MYSTWPLYFLLLLFVIAWLRVELKHRLTSRGISSIILGCLVLSHGFINWYWDAQLLRWLTIAVGFGITFYGVARLVAWMVTQELKANS